MILYEWVYNRGKIAEGVFCSEQCAVDMYADNPQTLYKGGPSPLDERESKELAADWEVCYGCGKAFGCEILHGMAEKGIEFIDKNRGLLLLKRWGTDYWLFYKHPDGQWVSLRKASKEDIDRVRFAVEKGDVVPDVLEEAAEAAHHSEIEDAERKDKT